MEWGSGAKDTVEEKKKRLLIYFRKKYFFNLYLNIKKKKNSYNPSCTVVSLKLTKIINKDAEITNISLILNYVLGGTTFFSWMISFNLHRNFEG